MALKIAALCVAVAMICSALRTQRPELATAVSLAGGLAALAMLAGEAVSAAGWIEGLQGMFRGDGDIATVVLKGAGIALVSELGSQLCEDAGERALAGRIALASRVCMLGLCAPLLAELTGLVRESLS